MLAPRPQADSVKKRKVFPKRKQGRQRAKAGKRNEIHGSRWFILSTTKPSFVEKRHKTGGGDKNKTWRGEEKEILRSMRAREKGQPGKKRGGVHS